MSGDVDTSQPHLCDHRTYPTSTPGACRILPRSRAHTGSSDITISHAMRQMSWILGHFWLWWARRASRRGVVSVWMMSLDTYVTRGRAGAASGGPRGRREVDESPNRVQPDQGGKRVNPLPSPGIPMRAPLRPSIPSAAAGGRPGTAGGRPMVPRDRLSRPVAAEVKTAAKFARRPLPGVQPAMAHCRPSWPLSTGEP